MWSSINTNDIKKLSLLNAMRDSQPVKAMNKSNLTGTICKAITELNCEVIRPWIAMNARDHSINSINLDSSAVDVDNGIVQERDFTSTLLKWTAVCGKPFPQMAATRLTLCNKNSS